MDGWGGGDTKSAPKGLRKEGKCIFSKKAEPRKTKGNVVGKARYKAKMFPLTTLIKYFTETPR